MTCSTCPYCGVGCGVVAANNGSAVDATHWTVIGDTSHPANAGRLCVKGSALSDTLSLHNRLLFPMMDGQRTNWELALDRIADAFRDTQQRYGKNSVALYVSGQLLTEDYYVANKFTKGALATGNIDTNSRLCMASAVVGHQRAFGEDVVPGCYEDFDLAELIIFVGSNAAWTHPVLFQRALAARAQNGKTKIVVIDPRRTASAEEADLHLPLRAGSDGFLFNGLLHYLKREDAVDWGFLSQHTEGWVDAFTAAKTSSPSIPSVAQQCELAPDLVATFFHWFAKTEKTVTAFTMGINQSESGSDNVNAIINVHLATGRIGKPGASPFSLTGQPNAMGGREVGGLATQLAVHRGFSERDCNKVQAFWGLPAIAREPGLKAVDMFEAIHNGSIKALWIIGTNPAVSLPDRQRVRAALARCDFVVVSDVVRHNDTMEWADVVLPALAWSEKDGTVTNSERCVSRQRAFRAPPGEAKPDWWALTQVAHRLGFSTQFPYQKPSQIFREHCALSARNHDRVFNLSAWASCSDEEYENWQPRVWPPQQSRLFGDGQFATATRRARLLPITPTALPKTNGHLRVNTGRLRDQWHTMTRTGDVLRLCQHTPLPRLYVHSQDAKTLSVNDGDWLREASGTIRLRVQRDDTIKPGDSFAAMHWTAQCAPSAVINDVVAARVDRASGEPAFKHSEVRWQRWRPQWQALVLSVDALSLPHSDYAASTVVENGVVAELAGDVEIDWPQWFANWLEPQQEVVSFYDAAIGDFRVAHLRHDRVQRILWLTRQQALPSYLWLASRLAQPLSQPDRRALLSGQSLVTAGDNSALICSCFSVRQKTIEQAIRTQNLRSVEAIGSCLNAGSNCGSCKPELRRILAQFSTTA